MTTFELTALWMHAGGLESSTRKESCSQFGWASTVRERGAENLLRLIKFIVSPK